MNNRLHPLPLAALAAAIAMLASPLHGGMVGYWNFDDGGSTAADASGNRVWGNIQGAASVAGKYGKALSFDGNDQVLIANVAAEFSSISSQATVAFWQYGAASQPRSDSAFSAQNSSGGRVLQSHLPWGDGNATVYWDAGNSYDRISKQAKADQSGAVYKGDWRHWAFTKDAGTGEMKIYTQGSEWAGGTGKTLSMAGIDRMAIGSHYGAGYYQGTIDEFSVWDEVLSPTAINSLATATQAMTITAPVIKTTLTNSGGAVSPGGDGIIGTTTIAMPVNTAPGGTASQSSDYSAMGVASKANDGNTNGDWAAGSVSHTVSEATPWWKVDLGALKTVDSVSLFNRTDCCSDRLTNFRVSVLDTDGTTEIWGEDFFPTSGYPNPSMNISLPADVVGQFVQVQLKNTEFFALAEVQVNTLDGLADFIQAGDGTLAIDIDMNTLTSDLLIATGGMQLGGTLQLNLMGTPAPAKFDILDWSTMLTGRFDTLDLPTLPSYLDWDLSQLYSSGTVSIVPEPTTMFVWALLTFCASMGAGRRGRRRQLGGSGGGAMRARAAARNRRPWTPEQRGAIEAIIERGRISPPQSNWADADSPW